MKHKIDRKISFSSIWSQTQIPIIISCFNDYTYLKKMIEQLLKFELKNIIVIDNGSSFPPLLNYLREIEGYVTVIYLKKNIGPRFFYTDETFFSLLPQYFCVTDPDLEFNKNLPTKFISYLIELTEEFKVGKAGFSLDISDIDQMVQEKFNKKVGYFKIWEWEKQFWLHLLRDNIYRANIATTFAVYNKKYFDRNKPDIAVRVAGDYTCKHLPWYKNNKLPKEEENYYRQTNKSSYYLPPKTKTLHR
jgi:glycosyltransferase involved in cell wall biosynthesis